MKKKKKYNDNLRLVVMNEDTFEEKYSFTLNLKNFYILLSTIVLVLFILIFLFISFTPMKHLVPGYGDIENNSYIIKLNRYISDLEVQIEAQDVYNTSLRKILVENDTSFVVNRKINNEKISDVAANNSTEFVNSNKGTKKNDIYIAPLKGEISKKIDIKIGHYGVDIVGSKNAPIKSIMNGAVIFSGWNTETGNTIILQHSNGFLSVYKHNSALFKEIGDFVDLGEAIGVIGNTGTLTDGPHLHFELWYRGVPLDPMEYIKF